MRLAFVVDTNSISTSPKAFAISLATSTSMPCSSCLSSKKPIGGTSEKTAILIFPLAITLSRTLSEDPAVEVVSPPVVPPLAPQPVKDKASAITHRLKTSTFGVRDFDKTVPPSVLPACPAQCQANACIANLAVAIQPI